MPRPARRPGRAAAARPRPAPAAAPGSRRAAWVAALVAAIVLAAFRGVLRNGFVDLDDPVYVTQDPLVLAHRYGALLRAVVSNNWHPLTMWTLAWNAGAPPSATPFLVTNVLLHALDSLLVYALAWRLSGRRVLVAAFAALLFGLHPMHVESVAWVSERKDVLHALFYLGAALAYVLHLEGRGGRWLWAAFGLFVLACLAKGMAVSFPLAMVALDLWMRRAPFDRRALLEKLPFLAVALLFGLIAVDVQAGGDVHGLLNAGPGAAGVIRHALPYPPHVRALLPALAAVDYLVRLFVPAGAAAFHPYPSGAVGLRALLAAIALLALVAAAAWDLRRSRILAFGLAWFLGTVVFVLQWIPVGVTLTADRYTYLPYAGAGIALGIGLDRLARRPARRVPVLAAGAAFLALLFVLAGRQVTTWRSGETLWTRVLQVHPGAAHAYAARGNGRLGAGRMAEGEADLREAWRRGGREAALLQGMATLEAAHGRPDSALALLDRAIAIEPGEATAWYNRALVRIQSGRLAAALPDVDRALALAPGTAVRVLPVRGFLHARLGDYAAAEADFDRAIAAGARDADTFANRGFCRLQRGDRAGAVGDFRRALEIAPGQPLATQQMRALEGGAPGR